MKTNDEIFALCHSMQQSIDHILDIILEKTVKSVIEIEDDLIDRFFNEIKNYEIDFDFSPGLYDQEDLRNKASYYFSHRSEINSPRPYLLKVLSQVKQISQNSDPVPGILPGISSFPDEIDEEILRDFEKLDAMEIRKLRLDHKGLNMVLGSSHVLQLNPMQKACVVHYAKKSGVL